MSSDAELAITTDSIPVLWVDMRLYTVKTKSLTSNSKDGSIAKDESVIKLQPDPNAVRVVTPLGKRNAEYLIK